MTTTRQPIVAAIVAALLLAIAGCSGSSGSAGSDAPGSTGSPATAVNPGGPEQGGGSGSSPASRPSATSTEPRAPAAAWPTYHHDLSRAGAVAGGPAGGHLQVAWRSHLDGAVYASPLVVGDTVVAATENDSVYALRRSDGTVLWRRNLGTPVPLSDLACGNIDPLGITGTPAYDRATGAVYAVAELSSPIRHVLVALDAATGRVRWRRGLDLPGMNPPDQQQRAALAVASGRVYVALGGLFGDCGDYHGYVIGVRLDGTGPVAVYRTPSPGRAGIWAPPGPAVDAAGHLYVTVGNGARTSPPYDDSDAVVELTPDLRQVDLFAPAGWAAENAADLDLASTGAVLLPGRRVLASGKAGQTYLLRAGQLGGVGGQLAELGGCHAFGGSAARGRLVVLPCVEGVRAVDTSGDRLREVWRGAASLTGTPVFGSAGVWALDTDGGRLHLLDAGTGRDRASIAVGAVTRFAAPAIGGGMILVPTVSGIVAVTSG